MAWTASKNPEIQARWRQRMAVWCTSGPDLMLRLLPGWSRPCSRGPICRAPAACHVGIRPRHEALAEPIARFRQWLDTESRSARPTSAFGRTLTYTRNRWETLVAFLIDGNVPVDNNASERHLRGPVVGRKNWMFAGSEGGAKAAAICFSIVGSCVLAGIDP